MAHTLHLCPPQDLALPEPPQPWNTLTAPRDPFPQQYKLKEETFLYITLKKINSNLKRWNFQGICTQASASGWEEKPPVASAHGIHHVCTLGKNPRVQTAPKNPFLGTSEPLKCCCFTPKPSRDKGGGGWAKSSWNSSHKTMEIKHWKSKLVGFWGWNLWPPPSSCTPNSCKPGKNKTDVISALNFSTETKEKAGKEEDLY